MIYACLLMCIKSSFTTSSISLPPCLRHPPYQGWIFSIRRPEAAFSLAPSHRCRGVPEGEPSGLPFSSFFPSTFRQSVSYVPATIVQLPARFARCPRTRGQVGFRLIRAFHIRLCKIPINIRRCISIDTFPHPAPRIPHPVISPRLSTFPIYNSCRISGTPSRRPKSEIPNPFSPLPVYSLHKKKPAHQCRHLPAPRNLEMGMEWPAAVRLSPGNRS